MEYWGQFLLPPRYSNDTTHALVRNLPNQGQVLQSDIREDWSVRLRYHRTRGAVLIPCLAHLGCLGLDEPIDLMRKASFGQH